jgi:amino acid adenylation domain-containing protein/FkbH-like protein
MSVSDVLHQVAAAGGEVVFTGEYLKVRARRGAISPELKEKINALSPQLARYLRDQHGRSLLPLAQRPSPLPLSFAQERLWFLDQLGMAGAAYNNPTIVRLTGVLDLQAFKRSFETLVERHEVLRTRFQVVDGSPVQVIDDRMRLELRQVDHSTLSADQQQAAVKSAIESQVREEFDLARGPLLRVSLIRLSEREHIIVLNIHHIISDGWSKGVLIREIAGLYADFASHRPPSLPMLPVQYADYAVWQRDVLQGEVLQRQLSYWKERLSGAPAALELPIDRMRPAVPSYKGEVFSFELAAELTSGLNELARSEGATLYMVLLAALQLLLGRHSGQDDIVVGSPIAGRTHRSLEGLIGFFVNTLVVRTELSDEPTFRQLLVQVKEAALQAYAHQDLPFERVVEELRPPRDLGRQPIFQILFALQNVPQERFDLPGLTLSRVESSTRTSKFDLSLYLHETPRGLWGYFEYATDLFNKSTIVRLTEHYRALLEQIVADPTRNCSQLVSSTPSLGIEVVISATFTGDPLVDVLRFWCERVGLTASIRTSGFNQVLQSLLADHAVGAERNRFHVILLRLEDWGRQATATALAGQENHAINVDEVERNASDFIKQMRMSSDAGKAHYFFGLCSAAPAPGASARNVLRLELIRTSLIAALRDIPRVTVLALDSAVNALGVTEIHDQYLDSIADIPYTQAFFVAAGTSVMRALFEIRRHPYKVVVVDCDNTLWRGICGEDGALGVTVTAGCRSLQNFLLRQVHDGILLCLCSRNNESDVRDVFRSNKDMLLSWEDIVSHRIGWATKSSSLVGLATELDLSLDSFVFLDDDAVECAKVELDCPDVLTLQVPQDDAGMASFLDRLWAFDATVPTAEDRKRAQRYREERQRRDARCNYSSLQGFIAGLELKVAMRPVTDHDVDRVVQMLERTTQFNTTGLRLTSGEVQQQLASADRLFAIVEVSDRFGDYGKSGLLVVDRTAGCWTVTCLALSCRVLGREVEYRVLKLLAEQAGNADVREIAFQFRQTARNVPAQRFLEELRRLAGLARQATNYVSLSPGDIDALLTRRQAVEPGSTNVSDLEAAEISRPGFSGDLDFRAARRRFYRAIALEYRSAAEIERGLGPALPRKRAVGGAYVAPTTLVEEILASIWSEVLKLGRVGIRDNFFEVGGHSLQATRLLARLRDHLGVELPLRVVFEAPTIEQMAGRVEAAQRNWQAITRPALLAADRPDALPLSYAQERLWLLERIGSLGTAYNMASAVQLRGALDVPALRRSFAAILERHEGLRTRFVTVDGLPRQVIDRPGPFELVVEDFSNLAAGVASTGITERTLALAQQPFDLEHDMPFRARLLRLSADDHVAIVVMHHIASDGWSIGILIRELGALYAAFSQGQPSPLPPLAVQYADYALWQRRWLHGEILERQMAFWREHLSGAPAALEIPSDHPRPPLQSYRGASVDLELSPELTARLNTLAREEGATLFMVLFAAFNLLLSRWSGQRDIVVGTPIAGRTHRQIEELIGFFVNTLALRTNLHGDLNFRQLLSRVREAALGAYAHQDLPFEKLLEALQPVRDLGRQPVFQVLFALQNVPQEQLDLPGLQLRRLRGQHVRAKLDLSLYLHEKNDRLEGYFEYATDLFERSTIERMADHLRVLLESIVASPRLPLAELPMLPEAERHRVVVAWNDTAADCRSGRCVHQLFEAQAAKTPDAVALSWQGSEMCYDELEQRSNQLAHHLRGLGVGPDVIVGLCIERSPEMVVGLLGILKAGGAYLPLDPGYPAERLAYMVADADAGLLLSAGHSAVAALATDTIRVVRIDVEAAAIARHPVTPPRGINLKPQNLFYVLYTSGSTGRPKGVMGTQLAVVNRLHWDIVDPSGQEVYIQKTTPNFIDMLWEVFMPLLRGQRVEIADASSSLDPNRLIELLETTKATRIVLVPSLMQAMLESRGDLNSRLPHLRYWACSGEVLGPGLAQLFRDRLPGARLYNVYGTSEFWDASCSLVDQELGAYGVPIGRLISNMQAYVLDHDMQPVPIGAGGELYVGGSGLARGYFGRPALTAERFVPSPFLQGERLYRTGDRARWRADGELEFLGRVDHQVKLRGFRIELGEIEATLRSHPQVRDAVTMIREDTSGEKRLVAYAVGTDESVGGNSLRLHLKQRLPDHMVPSAFVMLRSLPLTPNGKIDRRALPLPDQDAIVRGAYVEPRTSAEKALAGIWREILKLDRVGIFDNFFELGGHSLQLTQVHARLAGSVTEDFPVTLLFQYPTIHSLCKYFAQRSDRTSQLRTSVERGKKRRVSPGNRRTGPAIRHPGD